MIVVTGAAGFIGSTLLAYLNAMGHKDILAVDDFSHKHKAPNLKDKIVARYIHRNDFPGWLWENYLDVDFVYHMGARTDTTEQDEQIFETLNLGYTKTLWTLCARHQIPFIYASSAATYGLGEFGYTDSHDVVDLLKPLNPYGKSKNDFDAWALRQKIKPPKWAGMKFFNVYGPNEYHKGRMASVIFHTCQQIKATGEMKLFRSHKPEYKDGEQSRDFIYVKDVVDMLYFFYQNNPENGLYNIGTGQARTFFDLAANTFQAMGLKPNISFIDTPEDIRDTYQYFTEAEMAKLQKAGYNKRPYSLEEGIQDYVANYLLEEKTW